MDLVSGIRIAQDILDILRSNLPNEKKIKKIFTNSHLITENQASEFDRDKIFKWREKFINSGLPNLKESEAANDKLLTKQVSLTREIESILHTLINNNQKEIDKSK